MTIEALAHLQITAESDAAIDAIYRAIHAATKTGADEVFVQITEDGRELVR